jgi:hypothetical protein
MRCEKCGIEIVCKTDICPLCHEKVQGGELLPEAFPNRQKRRPLREIPFTKLYIIIGFALILLSVIMKFALSLSNVYWIVTAGALIYLYYCIRITVLSFRHFNMKIFGQTAALTALGIVLESVIETDVHIFEVVLPIIYIIAIIVVFVNIMLNINNARSYLVSFMFIAILGIIPIIAFMFEHFVFWPSIVVASVSAVTLILLVILSREKLSEEFTRIFHR